MITDAHGLRIMAGLAVEIAALHKDSHSAARSVHTGKRDDLIDLSFHPWPSYLAFMLQVTDAGFSIQYAGGVSSFSAQTGSVHA